MTHGPLVLNPKLIYMWTKYVRQIFTAIIRKTCAEHPPSNAIGMIRAYKLIHNKVQPFHISLEYVLFSFQHVEKIKLVVTINECHKIEGAL